MSLDFTLTEVKETEVFSTNVTHNLARMFDEAGVYDALYMSEGKCAGDIISVIEEGIAKMEAEPERFKPFSAKNGWGTYEQAIPWLKDLVVGLKENPDATIRVSK